MSDEYMEGASDFVWGALHKMKADDILDCIPEDTADEIVKLRLSVMDDHDVIEILDGLGERIKYYVSQVITSAGCGCCRSDEFYTFKMKLAKLLGVPRYDDDSGEDWYSVRDKLREVDYDG